MSPCDNVKQLIQKLTLEEKVSLLSGADSWQSKEISRLGIGSFKTTDGPSGARGHFSVDGPTAAFLPGPIRQAATWSKDQIRSIGRLLCDESKTKASQVLLAPTICLARNPLGGRNFESFGEDPFLTGSLAVEYVAGLQETGEVMATPKHFVANEQEWQRFSIDARVHEKALRELYLKPFEMVVRSSTPPGCIITSYNVINGVHADMNTHLIQQVLRGEWGYKGLVMSDWGDAWPDFEKRKKLLEAVKSGKETDKLLAAIDDSVGQVLSLCKRLGLLNLSAEQAEETRQKLEQSSTNQEGIKLMRTTAAQGAVLLKNDKGTLPLKTESLSHKKVAFIGPNAKIGTPGGGGSATMNPQYLSQPMDAFQSAAKSKGLDVDVVYSQGAYSKKWLPLLKASQWEACTPEQNKALIRIDFFSSTDLSGPILETQYRESSWIDLLDSAPIVLRQDRVLPYSFRVSSSLRPQSTGTHVFSVASVGEARVFVDGELIMENINWTERSETFFAFGSVEKISSMRMQEGRSYSVVIEGWTKPGAEESELEHVFAAHPSLRIGYQEELPTDIIDQAVEVADESEYSVVILGLDDEWESEGYDRQTMDLPGNQNQLAEALLTRCKRPESLIFVNQSGSPVELPWENRCSTLIQAWYGGQEAGNALADLLLGVVNPSGRMPISWPRKYSDLPFAADPEMWPGVNGQVWYKEDCRIGYRYYLNSGLNPHFWFGYGLSYSQFTTSITLKSTEKDCWVFSADVENVGAVEGQEVVQVYAWSSEQELERRLVSFEKTSSLKPGQGVSVTLVVRQRDLAHWEGDSHGQWVLTKGVWHFAATRHAGDKAARDLKIQVDLGRTWNASEW
ncbi:glycoside hydrolase superfamily [Ilyonectria sp. MPI-CAGE-AT-0026]|nr:glycoside hydrolase superfamily [Ilyonectria sp. MPI-CAGE-AT-0026]